MLVVVVPMLVLVLLLVMLVLLLLRVVQLVVVVVLVVALAEASLACQQSTMRRLKSKLSCAETCTYPRSLGIAVRPRACDPR